MSLAQDERSAVPLIIELVKPPEAVDVSSDFTVMMALDCAATTDLSALTYEVRDGEALIATGCVGQLIRFDPNAPDFDPRNGPVEKRDQVAIQLKAPQSLGAFCWHITIPNQKIGDELIAGMSVELSATTLVHRSSLAVWDVPSPLVAGQAFSVKIGGKCSAGCDLCGLNIKLQDEAQSEIATGRLDHLHPELPGLWCGEVEMVAPASPGLHHFTLHFTPGDARGKPHALAQAQFSIMVADAPDHAVEVSIIDEETGEPINEAHVRLGIYRLSTHDQGRVRFAVPKGEHRLFVWKAGFEIPEKTVIVEQDLNLTVAAKALPKKNPYERWQG